jgi:Fur family transcriptional regulator, ferric uptake regulator
VDPGSQNALELFHQRIGAAGLKSTKQRDAIVETFFDVNRHISVQELHEEVKKRHPGIGYATVYRTMKVLVEHGFAKRRDFGDGITRYDPLVDKPDDHDHLICVDCREVFEFKDRDLDERQHRFAQLLGAFRIKRRKLELYAICQDPACPRRPRGKKG